MKWPYHERKLKYLFHFDHAKAFKCNAVLRTRHFKIGWFLKYVYSIEIQLTMILHFFLFQVDRRDCLHCILCINLHNNLAQIQKRLYDFWIEPTVPPPFSLLFHNTTAYPVPGFFNYQVYFRNFIFDETAVLYFLPQPKMIYI